jgi:predicted nucleic acid-binding protein
VQAVVSDTGPLHYLVLIGAIGILPQLFTRVVVSSTVRAELDRPETPARVRAWVAQHPAWLEVRSAPTMDVPILRTMHAGERDAIALAVELHADLLLMDDRAGVTVARTLGLVVTGTLGLLAIAHEHGLVDLETALAHLKETNFRYRQGLLDAFLARHGKPRG